MKTKFFIAFLTLLMLNACSIIHEQGKADDDLYFSPNDNKKNTYSKIVPIDIEKIKKNYPSQVDPSKPSGYYSEGTQNQNAVAGYPAYKQQQDSLYKINPQLSGYYQAYSIPPFSLRDQYLQAKIERRQARSLARINNRNNFNNFSFNNGWNQGWNNWGWNNNNWNNWGWNSGFNNWGGNNWGFNNFGPSLNFGWNSFNGWNTGVGFGFNNFYDPWNYCNFNQFGFYGNHPNNFWGYNPWMNYNFFPSNVDVNRNVRDNNQGISQPRQVIGSNLPAVNGGTLENPNPNPLKFIQSRSSNDANITPVVPNPIESRTNGSGGVLINTPSGVQYISPSRVNNTPQSYNTFDKSVEVNKQQVEIQKANPQLFNVPPASSTPVAPNIDIPNQSRSNIPQPSYQQPNSSPPVYVPSRSNGGGGNNNSGGNSSGGSRGGGSSGSSGGGVSRPR